jgi:uncharacterized membrane protein YphA (DoxX/SURF4 family)
MTYSKNILRLAAEACRLIMGAVFVFSGFVKAIDPAGFAIKIEEYLAAFALPQAALFATPAAVNLSAVEFALGMCILLGVYRRYSAILALVFMLIMTPLTLYLALFNPVQDCGCFGDAVVLSNWQTFGKNVFLLAAALFLLAHHRLLFQFFSYKAYGVAALFIYMYAVGFSLWNYNHLPLIDFRPYKTGASIPRQMEIPPDAPQDVYESVFIYEKNGVKQEFTLDNYPADDPSWKFTDTRLKLVKEGFKPRIETFYVYDADGADVSGRLLHSDGLLLLLVIPRMEEASDKPVDALDNLYEYAREHNISFYCVTGSAPARIRDWINATGAEYPFLFADHALLTTIIRSNPGLVLLSGGTVLGKWHYNDMPPDEEAARKLLAGYADKNTAKTKGNGWIYFNLTGFAVPLLLVWTYERRIFRRRKKNGDN